MRKEQFKHFAVLQLLIEFFIFFTLVIAQAGLSYSAPYSRNAVQHSAFQSFRFERSGLRAQDRTRSNAVRSFVTLRFPFDSFDKKVPTK